MGKLLLGVLVTVFLVLGLMALGLSTSLIGGGPPSTQAQRDIPAAYLPLYQVAADSCPGLPWSVLAAIGKVESDHGRSTAPGVTSGANFAGAAGPMQIGIGGKAGNTFAGYAVDADGGGADVYNPPDAVFTAANYLCRNGAARGADVAEAVFAYNHADWYVTKVLAIASGYAATQGLPPGAPAGSTCSVPSPPNSTSRLAALQRRRRKKTRRSPTRRSGTSMAGKCPPRSNSDQCSSLCSGSITCSRLMVD